MCRRNFRFPLRPLARPGSRFRYLTLTATLGVAGLALCATAKAQAPNDHLTCYQVKDALNLAAVVDLASPQFGLEAGCKVGKAKYFCVPAEKTVISAEDKKTKLPIVPLPVSGPDAGDRICYKVKCPKPIVPIPDQPVTDQFGNRTVTKFKTSYLCAPAVKGSEYCGDGVKNGTEQCDGSDAAACSGACQADCTCPTPRFVDNGDGTVTDRQTGLQWEKKTDDGSLHDKDQVFSWSFNGEPYPPDGTAFLGFLTSLNGGATGVGSCTSMDGTTIVSGFASHCDWRLPSIVELRTILDLTRGHCAGGSGACIDPIFGPTEGSDYWSSTTYAGTPGFAWLVSFGNAFVFTGNTDYFRYVRAVRGGL